MVQHLPPSELKLNPRNPRVIKNKKFELLVNSLREDPEMLEARPIVTNPDKVVLGGNMRLKAAQAAGLKTIPVYVADWDEVKQRRFIIKDNSSYGEWDWDMLLNDYEPEELQSWAVDVPDYEEPADEVEDDNYEIPDELETDIQPGDRFQIGPHRLVCGDSTLKETFETLLPETWANCVITDPPYNVDYQSADGKKIQNDNMSAGAFRSFLTEAFTAMNARVKMGGSWYIFHADSEGLNFRLAMRDALITMKQNLVWVKNALVLGRQDYQWQHEPILYGWKPGAAHYFTDDRTNSTTILEDPPNPDKMSKHELQKLLREILQMPTTTIHHDKPSRSSEHPTMKPVTLVGYLMQNSTKPGDVVLDGFLGSGSTMVAAHQLGRVCVGAEMDPKYCQEILDRMTALDPTLTITRNPAPPPALAKIDDKQTDQ